MTQKPIRLMLELVSLFTNPGDTVIDPFMGSGTTLVACAKLERPSIGIEVEERFFEIACQRVKDAYSQPSLFISREPIPQQTTFL
jgi:site-specific DNA-methyltransferase (adenine-specific)